MGVGGWVGKRERGEGGEELEDGGVDLCRLGGVPGLGLLELLDEDKLVLGSLDHFLDLSSLNLLCEGKSQCIQCNHGKGRWMKKFGDCMKLACEGLCACVGGVGVWLVVYEWVVCMVVCVVACR